VADELRRSGEECLSTCDSLHWEWAGSQRECAALSRKLQLQEDLWEYLFHEMPTAAIEVDAVGTIIKANKPAAVLLNTSAKFLENRLLLHFFRDREQFAAVIRRSSLDGTRQSATLAIRPRERGVVQVDATMIPRGPREAASWLWFLTPRYLSEFREEANAASTLQPALGG
jgi:nitrogen-specific signal transduction histidine kinase